MSRKYVIITPCRDEAEFLPITISSIATQSVLPSSWVIVDDGSTDNTPKILEESAAKYDFIKVVTRKDRGTRSVGPGVIDAFYEGLETIDLDQFDYLCKLDADLEMPPRYFEKIMERFETDPYLGNFSGKPYLRMNGRLIYERFGDENAIGAAKFYRVQCFKDIDGFVRRASWDGIDGHMCRLKGWIAGSEDSENIRFIHLRQMGSSHVNMWTGRQRWGRGKYFMGSAPYYVVAVSFYRMFERPFILGGLGILWGYTRAMIKKEERFDNRDYLQLLRRYELASLLFGKKRTLEKFNARVRRSKPAPIRKS